MKRGGPLKRKAGLPRYGSRIRSVSAKRAAKAGAYSHLRALVHAREGGNCARCGVHAPLPVGTVHHRRKQSQGGPDTPVNTVWTCYPCNGGWIEDNPREATRLGWTVPNGVDPADWPVHRTHYGVTGWFQPDEFGWTPAVPHPSQTEQQETA